MLDGLMKENESLKKGAGSVVRPPFAISIPALLLIRVQDKAKVSEETLRKQSENNMKALDTLLTENKRLKQEVRVVVRVVRGDPSLRMPRVGTLTCVE